MTRTHETTASDVLDAATQRFELAVNRHRQARAEVARLMGVMDGTMNPDPVIANLEAAVLKLADAAAGAFKESPS